MWVAERMLTMLSYKGTGTAIIEIDDEDIKGKASFSLDFFHGDEVRILYSINSTEPKNEVKSQSVTTKSCFEFSIYPKVKRAKLLSIAYEIKDLHNCDMKLEIGTPADFFMAIFEKVCREYDCEYAVLNDDAYIRKCWLSNKANLGMGYQQLTKKMIITTGKWFYEKWGYIPIYDIDMDRFNEYYDELDDDAEELENISKLFDESSDDRPYEKDFITANIFGQNRLLMNYIVQVNSLEDIDYIKLYNKDMYAFLQKMKGHYQTFFNAVHKYFSQTTDILQQIAHDECAAISQINRLKIGEIPSSFSQEEILLLESYEMWLTNFSSCQIKYFKVPSA